MRDIQDGVLTRQPSAIQSTAITLAITNKRLKAHQGI
jgi:hypothetical protein